MAGMDFKDIQNLIRLISRSDLAEFKMKDGEFELSIRTQHFSKSRERETYVPSVPLPAAAPAPVAAPPVSAPSSAPATTASDSNTDKEESPASGGEANLVAIKSPIVGTFYRSPSPEKGPYIKVGDTVAAGDVVCIVEAMKLFNEIESEISGKVIKVMVDDASPVEYDQVLFLVDPKG